MIVHDLVRVVAAILDREQAEVRIARVRNDNSTTPVDAMPTMSSVSIRCAESRACNSVPKNAINRV
jgi:hypothetical protein